MTMTISEALSRMAKLVLTKGESFEDAQAWDVIRSRLEVTDEMAERASRTYNIVFMTSPATHEEAMKAALVAALGDFHDRV